MTDTVTPAARLNYARLQRTEATKFQAAVKAGDVKGALDAYCGMNGGMRVLHNGPARRRSA